ncbi:MAG: ribonuclease H-like domain-containing protein [Acidobacteria bacterium]|nr:ribonuclease H-like domain-containing protein [Acidobacteriota bacterium]
MKDLASRLRAIVRDQRREPTMEPGETAGMAVAPGSTDLDAQAAIAAALGGAVVPAPPGQHDSASACLVIDRDYDDARYHGRRQVDACRVSPQAPVALFEPRLAAVSDWASRMVFFDIETTGLSGGAGTVAFLVGCGWFEADGFRVRQWLMTGPAGERVLLDALARTFDDASLLVTFNGRTFDVPFMEMRWAFHRQDSPVEDVPHFDMLPAARRLWSRREDDPSCSLTALERSVLGFHRVGDVPGFEIPARYFQFLRTGDPAVIEAVLEHNRLDLVSLAAVTAHALRLAEDGPQWCREPSEQLGLGHFYERQGDIERALDAYTLAGAADDRDLRGRALERQALLLRRLHRFDEAAGAWLRLVEGAARPFSGIERRAAEALAIHHEHRAGDLGEARRYAEVVRGQVTGRHVADVDHRLGRIARKQEKQKGDPQAAPLLDSD